jgi:phosphatidylinositol alpha-1,6-mannosyltransferase
MPKITLVTTEYPPFNGGVANYYGNLVSKMPEVQVICQKNKGDLLTSESRVKRLDMFYQRKFLPWLKLFWLMPTDTIIWVGQILPIGTVCLLRKLINQQKYFVSFHGLDWLTAQKQVRKRVLVNLILSQAEFITCNSHAVKNLLPAKYHNKCIIIYPANNLSSGPDLNPELLAQFKLEPQKYFFSVGRLVKRKGFKQAIEAMIKVDKQYKYVIAGQGPEQAELELIIQQNNLTERVYILNNLNDQQLKLLYQQALAFIFPIQQAENDIEGFGLVVLEAQSNGLPIIATAIGGVAEAVGNAGLLMRQGSVAEIEKNVNLLLSNKELVQDLTTKSIYHSTLFSWEKSAKLIQDKLAQYE